MFRAQRIPADREYVRTLGNRDVEVIEMPDSDKTAKFPNKWKGYYAYYAALVRPGDLLVKCDDDIVFIANLPVLLNVARHDEEGAHLMYCAPLLINPPAFGDLPTRPLSE